MKWEEKAARARAALKQLRRTTDLGAYEALFQRLEDEQLLELFTDHQLQYLARELATREQPPQAVIETASEYRKQPTFHFPHCGGKIRA